MEVFYTVDDLAVQKKLDGMDTAFSAVAWSAFLGTTVGPYLRQRAQDRFKNEGDDVSGKWRPLAESTQRIREASLGSARAAHPINVRTGELEDYITGSAGLALALGPIAELTFPGVPATGDLQKKVETAQRGSDNPRTPPRPVLGLNENDLVFVIASMSFYAQTAIEVS